MRACLLPLPLCSLHPSPLVAAAAHRSLPLRSIAVVFSPLFCFCFAALYFLFYPVSGGVRVCGCAAVSRAFVRVPLFLVGHAAVPAPSPAPLSRPLFFPAHSLSECMFVSPLPFAHRLRCRGWRRCHRCSLVFLCVPASSVLSPLPGECARRGCTAASPHRVCEFVCVRVFACSAE